VQNSKEVAHYDGVDDTGGFILNAENEIKLLKNNQYWISCTLLSRQKLTTLLFDLVEVLWINCPPSTKEC